MRISGEQAAFNQHNGTISYRYHDIYIFFDMDIYRISIYIYINIYRRCTTSSVDRKSSSKTSWGPFMCNIATPTIATSAMSAGSTSGQKFSIYTSYSQIKDLYSPGLTAGALGPSICSASLYSIEYSIL